MGWIATKAQKIKRDGKYIDLKPGDPVPEAETWPNREAWERWGYIKRVSRDTAPEPSVKVDAKVETVTEDVKEKPKRKRTYIKRKKKEE